MAILLGCVTHSAKQYCLDSYLHSLQKLKGDFQTLFIDNSRDADYAAGLAAKGWPVQLSARLSSPQRTLAEAYRQLRREFLRLDCTHLLILEQDVIAPSDTLSRLLSHHKPVAGGFYHIGSGSGRIPCVMQGALEKLDGSTLPPFVAPDGRVVATLAQAKRARKVLAGSRVFRYDAAKESQLGGEEIVQVYALGLGCLLVERTVLEEIDFRVQLDWDAGEGFCDMAFHDDCRRRGIPVFLDPNVKCAHLSESE